MRVPESSSKRTIAQQSEQNAEPVVLQRVLIVDDELPARRRLKAMIEVLPDYECIAEAANGEQAIESVLANTPDIVLMDIRMPGIDGLQAAHQLAVMKNAPAVIFCTAFEQHALEAFDAQAVGYLLKPIKSEHLLTGLKNASQLNRAQLAALTQLNDATTTAESGEQYSTQTLLAITSRGEERIDVNEIRALVADKKYVSAYLGDREIILDQSLKALELVLGSQFIRVHRNALVATQYIVAIENTVLNKDISPSLLSQSSSERYRVSLKGSHIAPTISRRHIAQLRRWMRS